MLSLTSKPMPIPVVFHNLKGYDGHLLTLKGNVESERRNKMHTKYSSYSLGNVRFIDIILFHNTPSHTQLK